MEYNRSAIKCGSARESEFRLLRVADKATIERRNSAGSSTHAGVETQQHLRHLNHGFARRSTPHPISPLRQMRWRWKNIFRQRENLQKAASGRSGLAGYLSPNGNTLLESCYARLLGKMSHCTVCVFGYHRAKLKLCSIRGIRGHGHR
jgi:hypothetical protein